MKAKARSLCKRKLSCSSWLKAQERHSVCRRHDLISFPLYVMFYNRMTHKIHYFPLEGFIANTCEVLQTWVLMRLWPFSIRFTEELWSYFWGLSGLLTVALSPAAVKNAVAVCMLFDFTISCCYKVSLDITGEECRRYALLCCLLQPSEQILGNFPGWWWTWSLHSLFDAFHFGSMSIVILCLLAD